MVCYYFPAVHVKIVLTSWSTLVTLGVPGSLVFAFCIDKLGTQFEKGNLHTINYQFKWIVAEFQFLERHLTPWEQSFWLKLELDKVLMIVDILDFESSLVPWNEPIVLVVRKAKHRYNLQVPELFDGCRNRQWKPESRKKSDKMPSVFSGTEAN